MNTAWPVSMRMNCIHNFFRSFSNSLQNAQNSRRAALMGEQIGKRRKRIMNWLEPGHPASDYSCPPFRLRPGFGATGRVLVSTQRVAHAPRVPFDAPPCRTSFPRDIRDEASRTTRDGACAPHFTRELEKLHPDNRHVKDT
jgi:hypothetical protein